MYMVEHMSWMRNPLIQSLHGWKPDGAAPSTWACSSNISKPLILPPLTAFSPSVAVLEWRLGKFSEGRITEAELRQLISARTWSREARAWPSRKGLRVG